MKNLVIISSVRNPRVISDYIKNADTHNFNKKKLSFLILTENFVDKDNYIKELKKSGVEGEVLNQTDREKFMHENNISEYINLIPKKTHAETSFGLIYMWLNKEFECGFFIDDDTEPIESIDYFGGHISNLNFDGKIKVASSDRNWVNVLYQSYDKRKLYPRGYPYSKTGEKIKISEGQITKGDVWLSQGLWTNIPDLDAIRILMDGDLNGQSKTRLHTDDYKYNFSVAKDNFITVCSMNIAFRREIVPAFYQLPMDDNPWRIARFDDIWSGIIAKKVLDIMDKSTITGFPLCEHNKAPRNIFNDISSEAPGYESNEYFSDIISETKISSNDIIEISKTIAHQLETNGKTEFIKYCGKFFNKWAELFEVIGG